MERINSVPEACTGTACTRPVARSARGTVRSSTMLLRDPHLVPRMYGDPVCWPRAKRLDQVSLQPRHWYPACSCSDWPGSCPKPPWLIRVRVLRSLAVGVVSDTVAAWQLGPASWEGGRRVLFVVNHWWFGCVHTCRALYTSDSDEPSYKSVYKCTI